MTRKQRMGLCYFILGCSFLTAWFTTLGDKETPRSLLLMIMGFAGFIFGSIRFIGQAE
jgi:hypothetical protein